MRSKALADLDELFARIDADPDLCEPCIADMTAAAAGVEMPYNSACVCPPYAE